MGVRESAISRRIRDLEDEIGTALFNRDPGGVCLTQAGQRFVRRARCAVEQVERAEKDVGAIGRGEEGEIRIGIYSSLASGFLAELIQLYDPQHTGVRLKFIEGGPCDHLPAVRQHQLDVAFITGTAAPDGCDFAHLWNERVYVVMSDKDRLTEMKEISWYILRDRHFVISEAQPGPEIYDYLFDHFFSRFGCRPSVQQQSVHRDTLMQIVAGGRELTLTSEATTGTQFPGVAYRPLTGEVISFSAIWSPTNDNPALRRFLSLARVLSKRVLSREPVTSS
jgi:DNA-binding transcriptional LysR family regulator